MFLKTHRIQVFCFVNLIYWFWNSGGGWKVGFWNCAPSHVVVVDVHVIDIGDLGKDDIVIIILTGQSCLLGRPDWSRLSWRKTSKNVPLRYRSAKRATWSGKHATIYDLEFNLKMEVRIKDSLLRRGLRKEERRRRGGRRRRLGTSWWLF